MSLYIVTQLVESDEENDVYLFSINISNEFNIDIQLNLGMGLYLDDAQEVAQIINQKILDRFKTLEEVDEWILSGEALEYFEGIVGGEIDG